MTATATTTTTFLEAATRYGVPVRPDVDSIVVQIDGERVRHRRLEPVQHDALSELVDVYIASGGFASRSVTKFQGRNRANLQRIWFLPFDCDLADFYAMPKEDVYGLPQDEIEAMLPALVETATDALRAQGLPVSGVEYTGHGILCRVKLAHHDNDRIAEIQEAHKELVRRINASAGFRLVDPACTDAGTRIVRLVGSLNGKSLAYGQPARQTRPLSDTGEYVRVDQLLALTREQRRVAAPTPLLAAHGRELPQEQAQAIVDALAPHWTLGQKHALSLAIGGMLAKAGVPEGQALGIVEALSADDRKPWDRANSVTSSYARVRAGADVRGYFALREWVPADVVEFVDGVLDQFRESNRPRVKMRSASTDVPPDDAHKRVGFSPSAPPADAYYGWIGNYREIMAPTTEAPDAFHLGAGLTLVGAMVGRRIRIQHASDALFPNLYTVLIGPSGSSRKDTAAKRMLSVPQLQLNPHVFIKPAFAVHRDVSSSEGLIATLKDDPNTLLYLSELSSTIDNAHRKGTSTILNTLMTAWDVPHVLQNLNKLSPNIAENPYLSIIACTQPGRLAVQITDEDIHSGFANRWLFMPGVGKDPMASPPPLDKQTAWDMYTHLKTAIERYGDVATLELAAEAEGRWDEWYMRWARMHWRDEEESVMHVRNGSLVLKIALIHAITDEARAVELRHLEPAISLVDWMWSEVKLMMRDWGVTRDVQVENRILDVLSKKGPMPRRRLQQLTSSRKWSSRDFAGAFEAMIRNGTVAFDPAAQVVGIPEDAEIPEESGDG